MLSLDQLDVIDTAAEPEAGKPKRRKAADREAEADYARAMGIRAASMEFRLISLLRYYTLEDVIEYWWKAQVTD